LLSISSESFVFHLLSRNVKVKIYKTIILPVVLYRYETWSLTLRERDEVTGEWRKLHNKELHNLYSFLNIRQSKSRKMRWAGHVTCMGEESVQGFGGKARRKETTWKIKA
jgi:hypothetical protein